VAIGAAVAVLALAVGVTAVLTAGPATGNDAPLATPMVTTTTVEGAASADPGDPTLTSTCQGIQQMPLLPPRTCRIVVPDGLRRGERTPVVILLHGLNTSSDQEAATGDWRRAAQDGRFTLVLPDGFASSWNAGGCCAIAQATGVDDVGYLTAVLDQVSALPTTDPSRVYVVGQSNGGMMAYAFGCARSDRIAGIASVAGTPTSTCKPSRSIPVLHIHGRDDQTVPYAGGRSLISMLLGVSFPPVPSAVGTVAQAMKCGSPSSPRQDGTVTVETWSSCGDGAKVQLVTIDGLGHDWPTGSAYDATAQIEKFFGLAS
jgi:polyhydroxybutyrate depolymerase